jgi:hypothetical protein
LPVEEASNQRVTFSNAEISKIESEGAGKYTSGMDLPATLSKMLEDGATNA